MTITSYSILFSFLWGSLFFLFLIVIRRYLLMHCAYNILLICSLFAIFRFVFIFDLNIPVYSDFLYQIGKGITLLAKKIINNSALQLNVKYNWNILEQIYNFFKLFIYIWILGSFFLVYKNLALLKKIMNLYKGISQSNNPVLLKILQCVKTDMKLDFDVRIIESRYIQVPFLYGFFRPTIYLDTCFLNENEIYAVIYHELTHFVRHDNWLKLLLHCIHILFWWNPMIRILSDNISDACEYRCDQLVTKNMDSIQKIDYASIINRMVGKNTSSNSLGISLVSKHSFDHVYDRLNTFLYPDKMNPAIQFIITVIAGIMVIISLFSIFFISQTSNALTPTDTSITVGNSYLIQNEEGSYDLYCMDELIDSNLTDLTSLHELHIKKN